MTFKHKLSRRLALLRNVLLVGLGVAAACDLQQLVGLLQSVVVTVTVSPAAPSVAVGGTLLLTATPKDANGNPLTGRTVTWASSAPAVATVSSTGLVTGMAAGAATITATCEKMSGAAAATVAAPAPLPVASVSVSPAAPSLTVGATVQLAATPLDASGTPLSGRVVTWATSSAAVATVSGSGLVTGVAAGTATITATSEGKSGTATATVSTVPVVTVTVSPATASIALGATTQLTATPKDASGNPLSGRVVTWATSSAAVATVSGSGLVTGVAAGTATITATSEGQSGTAAITSTATNPGTVTDLAVTGVTDSSVSLTFTEVTNGAGQPASYDIRWAVGTISWGSATSVARGTCATPVAGSAIGAKRSCTVLGLVAATGYQFQVIAFRGTLFVNAVFGLLSNVVSATTAASTAPVATVTVSPASASLAVGATQQFTATLKDAAGNTLTGRPVTWASSAAAVATVSASGLATGLVAGPATISASSGGITGSATLTVTASPPPPAGGAWPNEPAGYTTLTDWSYSQLVTSPTGSFMSGANLWNQTAGTGLAAVVGDAAAPLSPPGVAQITFPAGLLSGTEPWTLYTNPAPVGREYYTAFWWKASTPWQGDPSGIDKISFWMDASPGPVANLIVMMNNQNQAAYYLTVTLEFLAAANGHLANSAGSGTVWHLFGNVNGGNYVIAPGTWYRIELYFKGSTSPTARDGIVRWWATKLGDAAPTLVGNYTNVNFDNPNFVQFMFAPTWGGNSGVRKTETDYYWIDGVRLSRP